MFPKLNNPNLAPGGVISHDISSVSKILYIYNSTFTLIFYTRSGFAGLMIMIDLPYQKSMMGRAVRAPICLKCMSG